MQGHFMSSDKPEIGDHPLTGAVGKVTSTISKMSVTGGIVGKIAGILMLFVVSMPFVVWAGKDQPWITAWVVLIASAMLYVFLGRMMTFAEKHPDIALLDGDQWMAHHEAQKFQAIPGSVSVLATNTSLRVPEHVPESMVNQPDKEPRKLEAPNEGEGAENV
jgi:hypothetical protein